MFKFYNDPMVKEFAIVVLQDISLSVCEKKRESFENGIRENKVEKKRERKDVSNVKLI